MKYQKHITTAVCTLIISMSISASDSTVTISRSDFDALIRRIENLEARNSKEEVDGTSGATKRVPADTTSNKKKKAAPIDDTFTKFRFGGYAEALFEYKNYSPYRNSGSSKGASYDPHAEISIPRFVLAFDYKFSESWVLGAEIEFEYGGTGSSIEAEYGEGIEYEYEFEKGGEVALEQLHITKYFNKAIGIRAGHLIVPVGITNAHHEPVMFLGTSRPEGERTMLPCTWHETGISILGQYKGLSYELQCIAGLNPYGFGTDNWIQKGSLSILEVTNFTNPALAARLEYGFKNGLRLGVSGYYDPRTADNTPNKATTARYGINGAVGIATADLQYLGHGVTARANFIYGWVQDAELINKLRPNTKTGFPSTPVASNAMSYFAEVGYNVFHTLDKKYELIPFARYEHYNTEQRTAGTVAATGLNNISLVTVGIDYKPLPGLIVKLDYTYRMVDYGNYNPEQSVGIGIAYTGWFINK